ncbi:MAG: 50S ribosomal protein L21 [Ancalomicrobiaceae bacterium]|nr:50S ribosomal protein L21 [Ancalomicrobiaceae bacterium]
MFAVIKTGGKQYRVAADDEFEIERLDAEAGTTITFEEVLLVGDETGTRIGTPTVAGATVTAEVVELTRAPKVIAFKKRRRKSWKKKRGHRQHLTLIRITSIAIA